MLCWKVEDSAIRGVEVSGLIVCAFLTSVPPACAETKVR